MSIWEKNLRKISAWMFWHPQRVNCVVGLMGLAIIVLEVWAYLSWGSFMEPSRNLIHAVGGSLIVGAIINFFRDKASNTSANSLIFAVLRDWEPQARTDQTIHIRYLYPMKRFAWKPNIVLGMTAKPKKQKIISLSCPAIFAVNAKAIKDIRLTLREF